VRSSRQAEMPKQGGGGTLRSAIWRWRFATLLQGLIILALVAAGVLLTVLVVKGEPAGTDYLASGFWVLIGLGALALGAEYIDTSLGMGYGTIVAPVLLIAGFEPVTIIPAVLFTEAVTGLTAGGLHHRAANVDLARGSRDRRIVRIMALPAAVAAAVGAAASTALEVEAAEIVIGLVAVTAGVIALMRRRVRGGFSWRKVAGLGAVAALAKGLGGGGFGPIATAGQIAAGVPERNAVGIVSVAEGLASVAGLAVFVVVEGWPPARLMWSLAVGSMVVLPAAVWTLRLLPTRVVRVAVGVAACFLGALAVASGFVR